MNKMTQKIFGLVLALLLVGCAGNMTVNQSYQLPKDPNTVLIQTEAGKQAIGPEQRKPYAAYLVPMNPILEFTSRYGIRQDLYLEEKGSKPEKPSGENYLGTKIPWSDGKWYILVIDKKIDVARKGYIGSRDQAGQLHQYSLDGEKVYGQYEERFNWGKIKSLKDSGVKLLEVQPGDANDKLICDSYAKIAAQVEKLHLPGLGERLLRKIGVITNQHLFLALATNFSQFFLFFGVQYFPLIMEIAGVGAPDGPQLEQSVITNYDLGKTLAEEIAPIKSGMAERDRAQVGEYLKTLAEHNRVLKTQEALIQKQEKRPADEEYSKTLAEYNFTLEKQKSLQKQYEQKLMEVKPKP